jgi:hypothetical protein
MPYKKSASGLKYCAKSGHEDAQNMVETVQNSFVRRFKKHYEKNFIARDFQYEIIKGNLIR